MNPGLTSKASSATDLTASRARAGNSTANGTASGTTIRSLIGLVWAVFVLAKYFEHTYGYYLTKFAEFRQYVPFLSW